LKENIQSEVEIPHHQDIWDPKVEDDFNTFLKQSGPKEDIKMLFGDD